MSYRIDPIAESESAVFSPSPRIFTTESMMRLLITGAPGGPFTAAAKIAINKGASVSHAHCGGQAMALLRGCGVNLLMVEVGIDVRDIVHSMEAEHIHVPIVVCDTRIDVRAAVAAIHAGAREYISTLPDPDIIAAMLVAVADGTSDLIDSDEAVELVVAVAAQVKPSAVMVRRTIADVERDLILETLKHCDGNRTHAASVLGISVRTLRNKITEYAACGLSVPPPLGGDLRGAA
jgi:two-component system, response regulator FlrC